MHWNVSHQMDECRKLFTWCPEQMVPFGILALKGLCTGHDVRGPHRDEGPGNGTELKLFCCWLLHNGGGGNWPCSDVIEGPCASTGWWDICIWWWHIEPAQLGIGHCPPLLIPPLLQYGSTVKLSWLLEHFSCNVSCDGDVCRELILIYSADNLRFYPAAKTFILERQSAFCLSVCSTFVYVLSTSRRL